MLLDPPPLPTCCPPVSVGRTFPGEWGHKGGVGVPPLPSLQTLHFKDWDVDCNDDDDGGGVGGFQ